MKKLQLEHCTGRFYEDEVDEVSDQKDGFESKSEFMVLNTHSLTTKNGSSRDILINLSAPFPWQRPESYSERNKVTETAEIFCICIGSKVDGFSTEAGVIEGGCVSNCCSSRTAVDSSHRGFSRNQLIIFHGEVVHDYDENGAGEGLQNLKSRSAKAGGSYLRSLVILVKLMILVKLVILTNLVILTMSLLWHVGTFLAFLQPQG